MIKGLGLLIGEARGIRLTQIVLLLLYTLASHGSELRSISVRNAGDAMLLDQRFHLPLFESRQVAAVQSDEFAMIGSRLLRYSNDGQLLQVGVDSLVRHQLAGFEGLLTAPQGPLYAWSRDREIAAIGRDGAILWTHPSEGSVASAPVVDDAGAIYFVRPRYSSEPGPTLHLVKLLRDGSEAFEVDLHVAQGLDLAALDWTFGLRLLKVPESSELVLVGNMNDHTAFAVRVRADGSVRSYWKASGRLGHRRATPTRLLSDGSLVVGLQGTGDLSWSVFRIGLDGETVSVVKFSTGSTFIESWLAIGSTGQIFQRDFAAGDVGQILGRSASGQEVWSIEPRVTCEKSCYVGTLDNDDLVVTGFDSREAFFLERYSSSGGMRYSLSQSQLVKSAVGGFFLGETAEGHVLVSVRSRITTPAGNGVSATVTEYDEVLWLDLEGTVIRSVRQPHLGAPQLDDALLSTDQAGNAVLVSPSVDHSYDQASIVSAEGIVVQSPLAARDPYDSAIGAIILGDRLVVAHRFAVRQYANLGSGSLLTSTPSDDLIYEVQAYENGNLLIQTVAKHPQFEDILIPKIRLLDRFGKDIPLPPELSDHAEVLRFDSAQWAIVATGTSQFRVTAAGDVEPHTEPLGDPLWEIPRRYTTHAAKTLSLPGGDKLVFRVVRDPLTLYGLTNDVRAHIVRQAPDNTVRWRQAFSQAGRFPETDLLFATVTANAKGQILLSSVHRGSNRVVLRAIDGNDGSVVTRHVIDCPGIDCEESDFTVDESGQVQGVSFGGGPTDLDYKLIRIEGLWTRSPTLPLAAATGVWAAADNSGEGMAVQVDTRSNVLAASWYGYSRAQNNETKQLRWYTLAGRIESGAEEVALDIFEVEGGVFDSPPAAQAAIVGEARMRLVGCDRLEIRMSIDDGEAFGLDHEGGRRDLTLSRLIPSQSDCIDLQGQVRLPAEEFDSRVTGAWYQPETSGQGLFLYRFRPIGQEDFVLTGAWFAHDPPNQTVVDNPSPHWFTLVGSGRSADSFVVQIFQTLGGHFGGTRTRNSRTAGSAKVTSLNCNRLRVEYQFNDDAENSAFSGVAGSIDLSRIAGVCGDAHDAD